MVVEVNGKRLEVVVPAGFGAANGGGRPDPEPGSRCAAAVAPAAARPPVRGRADLTDAGHDRQGGGRPTVTWCEAGDLVVVLEAMKMEQPLTAHRSGRVADLQPPRSAPP